MAEFDFTKYHASRFDFIRGRIIPIDEIIQQADAGDVECMENLAEIYLNGNEDVRPDPVQAVYWLRQAAEAGSSDCMFNMGLHCAKGYGTERDFGQAVRWMEKAAAAGDEDAPALIKKFRTIADSEAKAKAGDAKAQAALAEALMHLGGSLDQAGPGKDYEEALKWAQKAADQGNADAMWTLALAYEHGRGTPEDHARAISWYEKGAAAGHAECVHNLAVECLNGTHIKRDHRKAFLLAKLAVQMGSVFALRTLGTCYQFGYGCYGNMKKAVAWYERSLEKLREPDLEEQVAVLKMMGEGDPHWGDDFAGTPADGYEPVDDAAPVGSFASIYGIPSGTGYSAADTGRTTAAGLAEPKKAPDKKDGAQPADEKKAYYEALEQYRKSMTAVDKQRAEYTKQKLAEYEQKLLKELAEKRDSEKAKLRAKIKRLEAIKAAAKAQKDRQGAFNFREKSRYSETMKQCDAEIENLEAAALEEDRAYENKAAKVPQLAKKEQSSFRAEAERRYPYPPEPKKPESLVREEAERRAARMKDEEQLVNFLACGYKYTAAELTAMVDFGRYVSESTVESLLRHLMMEGLVRRWEIDRQTYYSLVSLR